MFNALFGNAGEIDPQKLKAEFEYILTEDENIEKTYRIMRDMFVFTNKRLILVDRQGFTGTKVEYNSIPYRSITRFAVETAGNFDADSEMKIWLSGNHEPMKLEFKRGTDIKGVQRTIAKYILK